LSISRFTNNGNNVSLRFDISFAVHFANPLTIEGASHSQRLHGRIQKVVVAPEKTLVKTLLAFLKGKSYYFGDGTHKVNNVLFNDLPVS
jgi:hypothetical protein